VLAGGAWWPIGLRKWLQQQQLLAAAGSQDSSSQQLLCWWLQWLLKYNWAEGVALGGGGWWFCEDF